MASFASRTITAVALFGVLVVPAAAASRHHRRIEVAGVTYTHTGRAPRGGQALVSDGPGTGFGFHRLPGSYRVGAAIARDRQTAALHSAVADDAVESYGPFYSGIAGPGAIGPTGQRRTGVFSYPDGYGSPYFAGYYGPGDGADYGPFGHAYTN